MNTVINTVVGENRGKLRIWLEGRKIAHSFMPGDRFDIVEDSASKALSLVRCLEGSFLVSKRTSRSDGTALPLIELKGDVVEKFFSVSMLLRIVLRKGKALIEMHSTEKKIKSRAARFLRKLLDKSDITLGSVCTGLGVLDRSIHEGLRDEGIKSYTKFIVERDSRYVEAMLRNQPDTMFREDSIVVESGIEFVEQRGDVNLDILCTGLPCLGSSRAGASKLKLKSAEHHLDAGSAFYYWLKFIEHCQPIVIVLEQVVEYLETASMAVIRSVLSTLGYELEEGVFCGNEFGTLENRSRMCMVAVSKGLNDVAPLLLDNVTPFRLKEESLSEVLEDIPLTSSRWKDYQYLIDKEIKDRKKGNGFKRYLYDGSESSVGTIRRLYHKGGSCDQYLTNKVNNKTRLFSPKEHAKIKAIPVELIDGVSDSVAHQMLGQSICFPIFQALGRTIGSWTKALI